jgi:hypothetical protein
MDLLKEFFPKGSSKWIFLKELPKWTFRTFQWIFLRNFSNGSSNGLSEGKPSEGTFQLDLPKELSKLIFLKKLFKWSFRWNFQMDLLKELEWTFRKYLSNGPSEGSFRRNFPNGSSKGSF